MNNHTKRGARSWHNQNKGGRGEEGEVGGARVPSSSSPLIIIYTAAAHVFVATRAMFVSMSPPPAPH